MNEYPKTSVQEPRFFSGCSRTARFFIFFGAIAGFSLLYLLMYNTLSSGKFFPKPTPWINFQDYLYNFIPITVLSVSNYLIVMRLWTKRTAVKRIAVKIAADFAASFVVLCIVNKTYVVVASLLNLNPRVGWAGTVLCNTLIVLTLEIIYYFKRYAAEIRQTEEAKREALQYRYDSLLSQVNPHFLFNSLSILMSLIDKDKKTASMFTMSLSKMYRDILAFQDRQLVSLAEEMNLVKYYISILAIRYGGAFQVRISSEVNSTTGRIIPYTLYLLIENVVKHNVILDEAPVIVDIGVSAGCVTVSNNVNLKKTVNGYGIGHKYIADQYRQYGKDFKIDISPDRFTATVPFL